MYHTISWIEAELKSQDDYMVFILGAGFSKGYNSEKIPLINEFLKIAEDNEILKRDDDHKELVEFIEKYFGDYHDVSIETLVSFLTTDLIPDVSQKCEYRDRLYRQLVDIIVYILGNSHQNPETEEIKNIYQKFANNLVRTDDSIISFNYDLILDSLLKNTKMWSECTGYGFKIKGYDLKECWDPKPTSQQSKTIYLKLHGSLNWGRCIVPDPYNGNEIVVNVHSILPSRVNKHILPFESTDIASYNSPYKNMYETFIVPPILSKEDFYKTNILQHLWYKAKDELIKSKEIFVIGYSFPATDYLAEFLFRQSIASPFSKNDKKVIFINKDINDTYKRRVENIFQNCEFKYHECDVVNFLRTYVDLK